MSDFGAILGAAADESNYLTNKVIDQQFARSDARFASNLNRSQFKQQQDYLLQLQQQSLMNSPSANVAGLRKAGLNPAFNQGSAEPLLPTAPQGNASVSGYSANKANPLLIAELQNLKSSTEANNQQAAAAQSDAGYKDQLAEGQAILNSRMSTEDETIHHNFMKYLNNEMDNSDDKTKEYIRSFIDATGHFNKGSLDGYIANQNLKRLVDDNDLQIKYRNALEKSVIKLQINEGVAKKIAHMPAKTFDNLVEQTNKLKEEIKLVVSNKQLNDQQIKESKQRVQHILQDIRRMQDEDIAELVTRGEFDRISAQALEYLGKEGVALGGEIIKAKTFTSGMAKAAAAKQPTRVYNTTNTHNESKYYKGSSPQQHYGKQVHIENHPSINEYGSR